MKWKLCKPSNWPFPSDVWWEAEEPHGTYKCAYDKEREFGDGWVATINGDFIGSAGHSVAVQRLCREHLGGAK